MLNQQLNKSRLNDLLQPGMGPILFALEENEGCSVKTLAERTQRSTPTLSNTLKRMKAKGLIQTKSDKEDKRAVCISITAKSKKLLPRLHAMHENMLNIALSKVKTKKFKLLKEQLGQMSEAMRESAQS